MPAQAVNVAVAGKLENYLIGRTPVRDFPESNGHGRAPVGQAARSHAGVMIFKSSAPLTGEAINARLVAMAKDQKPRRIRGGNPGRRTRPAPALPGPSRWQPHAGARRGLRRARHPQPALGHHRRRRRRARLQPLGTVPITTIAPSLLFDDIGVKRATEEQQKLPYYGPPAL